MCVFCSLESSKNIIYRQFSGLLGQITMSEVKMGESLSLKNWGLKRSWRLSVKFPWGFGLCTCVSAAGLENMYVQIFRHACESGGTAELLAILIWVLSCKTAKFRISAQRVAVLLDMEGADGRLADTHGCAKTHPAPPKRSHLLAVWAVALTATARGGGQFNRGKGHRSQTVISVCGLYVSDSRVHAARGLCPFGGAFRSGTSSGLDVKKNFSKTGNTAAWGWRETTSCQTVQHSSVFWLMSARVSPQWLRSKCSNKSLFSIPAL